MKFWCYSCVPSFVTKLDFLMLQNEEETSENMLKVKPAREGNRIKRSYKNAKSHTLTERVRNIFKISIEK